MSTITSINPFDQYDMLGEREDTSASPSLGTSSSTDSSSDSPKSGLSLYKLKVMDPWTAVEKIIKFLSKKVLASRALLKFRSANIEKRMKEGPGKTSFTVEVVPFERLKDAAALLAYWNKRIIELLKEPSITEEDREKLTRGQQVLESIQMDYLEIRLHPRCKKGKDCSSLYIALDSSRRVQAIALVNRPHKSSDGTPYFDYRVEYLLTSPENLRLSIQSNCISGSATAIIEDVVFKSMRHTAKKEVSLQAAEKAITFYEKLGFFCVNAEENEYVLNSEGMGRFLSSFGGIALIPG